MKTITKLLLIALMLVTANVYAQTTEILLTDEDLSGISNAVLFNGKIHFVVGLDPVLNIPGNAPNSEYVKLKLYNESGHHVFDFEPSSVACWPQSADLKLTPDNMLAFVYQAPTGQAYGHRMHFKISDGTSLKTDEIIFPNANWGTWPRLEFDSDGNALVVSFAHAGHYLKFHQRTKYGWGSSSIDGPNSYSGDLVTAMNGDDLYILGRDGFHLMDYDHVLKLYSFDNGTWNDENIDIDISRSCDLKIIENTIYALYTQGGMVKLAENSSGEWITETIVAKDSVFQMANLFFKNDGTPVVACQNYTSLSVLEKAGNKWKEIFTNDNLIRRDYLEGSRYPSILYKNNELYVLYADMKNVYLTKLNVK